jgi:hypothetical protein
MKKRGVLYWVAMAYGILITLFVLVAFGPKFVGLFAEQGFSCLKEIGLSFIYWYDDPTAFFLLYLIGYALIWWKPQWGALVIALAGLVFLGFNLRNYLFFLIFILPTLLVALLYFIDWMKRRKRTSEPPVDKLPGN